MPEEEGQTKKALIRARGIDGLLEILEDGVWIRRSGLDGRAARRRKKDKEIPFPQVHSVLFKRARRGDEGFIQFVVPEVREVGVWLSDLRLEGDWRFDIELDENAVLFDTKQEAAFLEIREYLKQNLPASRGDERLRFDRDEVIEELPPDEKGLQALKDKMNLELGRLSHWRGKFILRVREFVREFGKPKSPPGQSRK